MLFFLPSHPHAVSVLILFFLGLTFVPLNKYFISFEGYLFTSQVQKILNGSFFPFPLLVMFDLYCQGL